MAKGEVRSRMVAGAARLLAEHGPPGASVQDVLAETGSPRGSTYHHFPGGRDELYVAALDLASDRALRVLDEVRGRPAVEVLEGFVEMWRTLLTTQDLRLGCAVLAVAVADEDAGLRAHSGEIFRLWRGRLASLLVAGGCPRRQARPVAALAVATLEGAVAVARAEQDIRPFDLATRHLLATALPPDPP